MLTLYVRDGCAYCTVVLHALEELGLQFEEKEISDDAIAQELIDIGGMQQVPFLLDSEKEIGMYESADIVEYLRKTYGKDGKVS